MSKKEHKTKSFLKGILGKKDGEQRVQEQVERDPGSGSPVAAPERPALTVDVQIPVLEGALLQLWRRWKGEGPSPVLSLNGESCGLPLVLDAASAMRERVRLAAQLEQDAKKRMRQIEDADNGKSPQLNAECYAYVSRDGMAAWVFIFPPSSPEGDLHIEAIAKALQAAKVTAGLDSSAVTELYQRKAYFELTPVACGTPVVEGENGRVIELFPREVEMEVKLNEDGTADYRASSYVRSINKGDFICEVIPPREGTPGLRVDGNPITPRPVRAARVPAGSNTSMNEEGTRLIASRDGHLEFSRDVFQVKPTLDIKGDVDYSTGNIDFRGDVNIHGDVRENFSVRATGTITIDGLVEAAYVEAGGDLLISCGVLGDNRAFIKSGGCIRAKYLENCVAYAGKCVFADCIISSQVFSDDAISVLSGRGTIIGGAMTAAHSVKARMIGTQSGRRSTITLGVFPYIQEEMNSSEAELQAIHKEQEELEKQIRYLEEQHGMEGGSEKLAKAHLRRSVLGMKAEKIHKRRQKLEPMLPDLKRCRLECNMVYPITILNIQDATWRADTVHNHCTATFDTQLGEIKVF